MQHDLNDRCLFTQVVDKGGLAVRPRGAILIVCRYNNGASKIEFNRRLPTTRQISTYRKNPA